MMIGTAIMLVFAGLIEGSFSQYSGKTFPYPLKIAVAVILFTAMIVFLFAPRPFAPRERGEGARSADEGRGKS